MSEKRFFNSYFTEHIIDKVTDKCYPVRYVAGVYELTDLLNELAEENERLEKGKMEALSLLGEEIDKNEQLKSYIDTIFEGNSHICKRLNVEDVQFYCERNRDYHYPTCTYKKCFDENDLIELKEKIRECNE